MDFLRPLWPALLVGVGLAGTLDEVILHQLLGWHHLYDRSTVAVGLVSDGIFHIASTIALVVGVLAVRSRPALRGRRLAGGIALGLGAFNLYDATIQHKVLGLHQVRPAADDLLPYDLAFGGVAVAALVLGALLLRGRPAPADPPR